MGDPNDDGKGIVDTVKDFLFGSGALKKAADGPATNQKSTVTPAQDPSYLQKQVNDYMKQNPNVNRAAPAHKEMGGVRGVASPGSKSK